MIDTQDRATPAIRLVPTEEEQTETSAGEPRNSNRFKLFGGNTPRLIRPHDGQRMYRIKEIEVDGMRLSLRPDSADGVEIRVLKPEFSCHDNATRG